MPDELAKTDAVVMDPPRAGAEAQTAELAKKKKLNVVVGLQRHYQKKYQKKYKKLFYMDLMMKKLSFLMMMVMKLTRLKKPLKVLLII